MTIADKLTYLSETKDLLADAINGYTKVVNADTPFREYAQWIDNIVFSAEGGIASLFDEGESGFAWSSLPYHQDPAGTTEAVWGNPVGLIKDATDNGVEFTQATVTARPILGRVPVGGVRNLIPNSYNISGSTFNLNNSSVVGDRIVRTSTTATSFVSSARVDRDILGGESVNIAVRASAGDVGTRLGLRAQPTYPTRGDAVFDLSTGTVVGFSGNAVSATIVPVEGLPGIFDCLMSVVIPSPNPSSSLSVGLILGPANPTTSVSGWETTSLIEGLDIRVMEVGYSVNEAATPIQRVENRFDITESGVESVHYLRFDGTDDSVSTSLPAITNGTLVLAGTNGIWIDDDFNHAGGEFSIGPTSYTGGPSGILDVVGDLIVGGSFVIDRQVTAQERARVINKLKSMGAQGVFELGPELVVNGTFDTDISGWIKQGFSDTTIAWEPPGSIKVYRPVDSGSGAYQVRGVQVGSQYLASCQVVSVQSGASGQVVINSGNEPSGSAADVKRGSDLTTPGLSSTIYSPDASSAVFYLRRGGIGNAVFDNASLRKLELIP